jgi:hypothetical protein
LYGASDIFTPVKSIKPAEELVKQALALVGSVIIATGLLAQEGLEEQASLFSPKWTAGGQIRLRQEAFEDVPIVADPPGVTRGGANNYFRVRSQLYVSVEVDPQVAVYGRLANEYREYLKPEDNKDWEFPDEVVVDNLYLNLQRLLPNEALSLRIGRQDLWASPGKPFGSGRLIFEGTPKDGSRTIFFDALRATYKTGKTQIDAIGIYNRSDATLIINDQDRDNVGYTKGFNDAVESGFIFYAAHEWVPSLATEEYYIYKREHEWLNGAAVMPPADLHTVGACLMPKFGEMLSASLEGAVQSGTRGDTQLFAYMGEGVAKFVLLPDSSYKPVLSAGVLLYSGDRAKTDHLERWDPLWGRYPQVGVGGDLLILTYDAEGAGWWSNLLFPNLSASLSLPFKEAKAIAMVGQAMAQQKNGPGDGRDRGLYAGLRLDATLARALVGQKDRLTMQLLGEVLDPGNYYKAEWETAYWARWELTYSF